MKLYNKIFESENLDFRKQPIARKDSSNISMGDWENQEEINRDFRELVKRELNDPANIKSDRDGTEYIDLNHLSGEAFKCTDFSGMFNHTLETRARMPDVDVSGWDVSRGQNFINMFRSYESFNCDLSKWDVSQGKNFYGMFYGCHNFNSDLSNWDVSNGVEFSWMFLGCHNFNSDLSKWDVSNGVEFSWMFSGCRNFNSDLSKWDVSNGVVFSWMFYGCYEFNSDLSKWNILDNAMTFRMFWDCPIEEGFKPKKLQNI